MWQEFKKFAIKGNALDMLLVLSLAQWLVI